MKALIGRKKEIQIIESCYTSLQSEFVVVYGRRRIGKTFLINQTLQDRFAFCFVGGHKLNEEEQLKAFAIALTEYSQSTFHPQLNSWADAFEALKTYLKSIPSENKKVVFIDEMPWIDTPKSKFVDALEFFWNGWAALRNDIFLIASGSATSWMADKLFVNQGGLYNRITHQIYLRPFNLCEVEEYLSNKGCTWDRYQILQSYMTFGGVPFYYNLLNINNSLVQNIDDLFFAKNARLRNEFDELYNVLFNSADKYISIVSTLSESRKGLTRNEISQKTKIQGGGLTKMLDNLEKCDFIISFSHYNHKVKDSVYKLSDMYTLFYLKFIKNENSKDSKFWTHNSGKPSVTTWYGLTFELVCLLHTDQIKKSLGISGMATSISTWRDSGSQIDLIIERADRMINLCEIKFSVLPYTIDKQYHEHLIQRAASFRDATNTRKGILQTFITTYGITQNQHSGFLNNQITMDSLFEYID